MINKHNQQRATISKEYNIETQRAKQLLLMLNYIL